MTAREATNRQFLRDLFCGPFRGHAILLDGPIGRSDGLGDYLLSDEPVSRWAPGYVESYEKMAAWGEAVDVDSVPFAVLTTNTGIFASAFGCPLHPFQDSNAAAMPIVSNAAEADRLPQPTIDAPLLARYFELADLVHERLGPEAPIGVPDIQSPFDVAALVWRKEQFFQATLEEPDAVVRLVDKCHTLIKQFLHELKRRYREINFVHCPTLWAPPDLGCSLSEDEVGAISVPMFEQFCLPRLTDLSESFGGLFMHCCATADHQYASFRKIPKLRGLNRVFQAPGPGPAVQAFSGETVLMIAWQSEDDLNRLLDLALPNTRFTFSLPHLPIDDAKRTFARLRERCPGSNP